MILKEISCTIIKIKLLREQNTNESTEWLNGSLFVREVGAKQYRREIFDELRKRQVDISKAYLKMYKYGIYRHMKTIYRKFMIVYSKRKGLR